MRTFLLPLICLLLFFSGSFSPVGAQSFDWTKSISGAGADDVFDVTTDSQGNSFIGAFTGSTSTTFGNLSTTGSSSDIAVAKFNPVGICLWANRIPVTVASQVYGCFVSADAAGNVYLGYSVPVTSNYGKISFQYRLNKYSSSGALLWAVQPAASPPTTTILPKSAIKDLLVDESGCPVIVCYDGWRTRLIRFSPSGNIRWTRLIETYSGAFQTTGFERKLANGPPGQFWVGGTKWGSVSFQTGPTLSSLPNWVDNSFLARYDTTGQYQWGTLLGQGGQLNLLGITDLGNGKAALSGRFNGTVGIGSGNYTSASTTTAWAQFVTEIGPSGNAAWFHQITSSGINSFKKQDLTSDNLGNITLASSFAPSVSIYTHTITASGGSDILLARFLTGSGNIIFTGKIGGSADDIPNAIHADAGGVLRLAGKIGGTTAFGNQTLVAQGISDGFLSRLTLSNTIEGPSISGVVYNDLNNNGLRDPGELPFSNSVIVEVTPGPMYATTNSNGEYTINVDTGTYTLAVPNPPIYHTVLPASHTVVIATQSTHDTTAAFGLHDFSATIKDLRVLVTNTAPFRPGFVGTYNLTAKCLGGLPVSNVSIVLHQPPGLVYNSSSVTPSLITVDSVVWTFANINPSQQISFNAGFGIPATTLVGTVLTATADIYPVAGDFNPADNHATTQVTVTGSFDPNDKQVSDSTFTPAMVAAGNWLEYTIRFQNTGNDTAFFVTLTDSLSAMLNPATFEMLAASHPHTYEVSGLGIATWLFNPIMLPDSTTNEPASHGFVRFRIKPRNTLQVGDTIENSAAIYFDYNAPVITNTAQTTIIVPPPTVLMATPPANGFCAEASFPLSFSISGQYQAGNQFELQLSDLTGSFASPTTLGTLAGTTAGTIQATLPASLAAGTGYRMRLVATSPATIGPDNGIDLTIWPTPQVNITASGPTTFCPGDSVIFSSSHSSGNLWSTGSTAAQLVVTATGIFTLTYTDLNGCTAQATAETIVKPMPVVTLSVPDSVQVTAAGFLLTGGQPASGIYSGPGVTGGQFNPSAAGTGTHTITYTYTDASGCVAIATQPIVVYLINAAPGSMAPAGFRFYPNPASGNVQVEWQQASAENTELLVTDVLGKVVYQTHNHYAAGQQKAELQIGHLPAGVYVLQLSSGQQRAQAKLVLQR